jgi:hypothetical protein
MKTSTRTKFLITIGAFTVVALLPVSATPQSLADVARKEEARRKSVKGEAKVYTNDDLVRTRDGSAPPVPASPATTAGAPGASTAAPPAAAEKARAGDDGKDQQYWRKRMTAAQDSVARNKVLLAALEARVNALNTDFVNMDDPYQRNVIQENLKTAMAELARVKQDIVNSTKAIADIEEEARKANVPPGWLR